MSCRPPKGVFQSDKFQNPKYITSGGFSRVYTAIDKRTNESVIIKYGLLKYMTEIWDESACGGILIPSEVKVIQHISKITNNIPIIKDYGNFKWRTLDIFYIAMLNNRGTELYTYIRDLNKPKLTVKEALVIFETIVNCMIQATRLGNVYHGDLKTSNIIINDAKEVTIIDWGSVHINNELCKYSTCTREYASPESLVISKGGDGYEPELLLVWSLGVILYELLTSKMLFSSYTLPALQKIGMHYNGVTVCTVNFIEKVQNRINYDIDKATNLLSIRTIMHTALRLNPKERCQIKDFLPMLSRLVCI